MPDPIPQDSPYTDEHLCVDSYYDDIDDDDDPLPTDQAAEKQPSLDGLNPLSTYQQVARRRLYRPPRVRGMNMGTNGTNAAQLAPLVALPTPGISTRPRALPKGVINPLIPPVEPSAASEGAGGSGDAARYPQPDPATASNSSAGELGGRQDQSVLGRRRSRSPSPAFDHIPRARMDDGAYQPRPRGVRPSGGAGPYGRDLRGRYNDRPEWWMGERITGDRRPRCEGPTTLPTVQVQSGLWGVRSAATVCEHIVEDDSGTRRYWLTPEEMENMKREREAMLREMERGAGVAEEKVENMDLDRQGV